MKRSYPTNVDGQIFYIDEDAFLLLQNYLQQLKITFAGEEGGEIVADIESRIREHFNEKIQSGHAVIVLADVNTVIETMGRPEDIDPGHADTKDAAPEAETQQGAQPQADSQQPFISINMPSHKRLYRNMRNKVFGGVIGGLAMYLGWNANIMRLFYIILTIASVDFLHFWPFVILYLIAWMIIPPAVTPRQILQMRGAPVNVDNVGRTVIETSGITPPPVGDDTNFFTSVFSIIGKCILAFIGFIASVCAIGAMGVFVGVTAGMISLAAAGSSAILAGLELFPLEAGYLTCVLVLVGSLIGFIISGAIAWACAGSLFNLPKASRTLVVSLVISCIMLIIAAMVLGFAII